MADLGAFDECIETVIYDQFGRENIRGQYCNVDIRIVNDTSIEDFLRPAATLSHRRVSTRFFIWSIVSLDRKTY